MAAIWKKCVPLHANRKKKMKNLRIIVRARRMLCLAGLLMCCASMQAQIDKNHNLEVEKNLEILNTLYSQLDLFYVDTLNPGQTMTAAIKGMLRSLDPYTEYYPE